MIGSRIATLAAACFALLSGCLPYSCRPNQSEELLPSDSLSRRIARSVPMDTLRPKWTATGEEGHRLEYPRTLRFGRGEADSLIVSDVERNSLFVFDAAGEFRREIPTLDVPYIAGIRGDTLAVFSPADLTVRLTVRDTVIDEFRISDDDRPETALVYAAYGDALYYKRVSPDVEGFVGPVGLDGRILRRFELRGPHWRHAGLLRTWGDSLLSLSGFRPVVDVIGEGPTPDTLALRGFDSPMLARSRSFMLGDVHEAPLLSATAAAHGPYLFVLNMRAGWLQIDVFGRDGMLLHRLTEPQQEYSSAFFPQDVDVRGRDGDVYEIAVAFSQPRPEIRLYTWEDQ